MKNILLSAFMALALASPVAAQAIKVDGQSNRIVNAHGVCRNIINSGGTDTMVSTNTAAEWSTGTNAFLNNIGDIPNVSASRCFDADKIYFRGFYMENIQGPKGVPTYTTNDLTLVGSNLPTKVHDFPSGYTFSGFPFTNPALRNPGGVAIPACVINADANFIEMILFRNTNFPETSIAGGKLAPPNGWDECTVVNRMSLNNGQRVWEFVSLMTF